MLTGPPQMCPTMWRLSTMAPGKPVTWSLKPLIGRGHNNGTIVLAEAARFTFFQLVWAFLSQRGISWEAKGILLIVSPVGHIPGGRRVTHLGRQGWRAVCSKVRWQIPALLAVRILRLLLEAWNPFHKPATAAGPSEGSLEDGASLFPTPSSPDFSATPFSSDLPHLISGGINLPKEIAPSMWSTPLKLLLAFAQNRSFIGTDTPALRPCKTKLQAEYSGYFWGPFWDSCLHDPFAYTSAI